MTERRTDWTTTEQQQQQQHAERNRAAVRRGLQRARQDEHHETPEPSQKMPVADPKLSHSETYSAALLKWGDGGVVPLIEHLTADIASVVHDHRPQQLPIPARPKEEAAHVSREHAVDRHRGAEETAEGPGIWLNAKRSETLRGFVESEQPKPPAIVPLAKGKGGHLETTCDRRSHRI
jgi:hypothetical protein